MQTFELETPYIELYKILKIEGWVGSGGIAKLEIADGQVRVNGELETRKRRKVLAGDEVEYAGQRLRVVAPGA